MAKKKKQKSAPRMSPEVWEVWKQTRSRHAVIPNKKHDHRANERIEREEVNE